MAVNKVTTQELGWAGHCPVASRCDFIRHTVVKLYIKKKLILSITVSTVGGLRGHAQLFDEIEYETIGLYSYYETLICLTSTREDTADTRVEYSIPEIRQKISKPNRAKEANLMHETNVKAVIKELNAGGYKFLTQQSL